MISVSVSLNGSGISNIIVRERLGGEMEQLRKCWKEEMVDARKDFFPSISFVILLAYLISLFSYIRL